MGKDLAGKELGRGISQRKDAIYCGTYNDRFGKRNYIYDKNLKSLRNRLTKLQYEDSEKLNVISEDCTLDEWFEKWVIAYKKGEIRDTTLDLYTSRYYRYISKELGKTQLNKLTRIQLNLMMRNLKNDGLGWSTQRSVKMLLHDMLDKALDDKFINDNPAKGIRIDKRPKSERRVLTREENAEYTRGFFGKPALAVAGTSPGTSGDNGGITIHQHIETVPQTPSELASASAAAFQIIRWNL